MSILIDKLIKYPLKIIQKKKKQRKKNKYYKKSL